jgi:phosphate uptake regulator
MEINNPIENERRKLGTTAGGSTYMITLPKNWIEELGLEKGANVSLVRAGRGIYLATEVSAQDYDSSTKLVIREGELREAIGRSLISRYIAGFDIIEIEGDFSTEQRELIRQTAQRLIGAEILQETGTFVLIRMLRDPHMLSVDQLLQYIQENAEEMLKDAPLALIENDIELAGGIIQRDERVDRFFLFLSRQLYGSFRDPLGEVEQNISRVDFFNTHTIARQLERVADHAVKIARACQALADEDLAIPSTFAKRFKESSISVQNVLHQAIESFKDLNESEAHDALSLTPPIEKLIEEMDRELLDLDNSHLAFHLGIVLDSIGRVKDYAANIAEVSLNAESLQRAYR